MNKDRGFTLMELMVVVAIVGILGAVAYPSYIDSTRKARRADAQADLIELSGFMERFFTENNRYDQNTAGAIIFILNVNNYTYTVDTTIIKVPLNRNCKSKVLHRPVPPRGSRYLYVL